MFATLLWIVDGHVNGAGAGFRVVRGRVRASANLSVNQFRSIAMAMHFKMWVAVHGAPKYLAP